MESAKVIIVGESSVGKTSLIFRYIYHTIRPHENTVQPFYFRQPVKLHNIAKPFFLDIWDTPGQAGLRETGRALYRNADAIFIVVNAQNKKSAAAQVKEFHAEILENGTPYLIIVVVNKCDLIEDSYDEIIKIREYAKNENMLFFIVSAQCNIGIQELFQSTAEYLHHIPPRVQEKGVKLVRPRLYWDIEERNKTSEKCLLLAPGNQHVIDTGHNLDSFHLINLARLFII